MYWLVILCIPSLLALTFGTWTAPVLTIPILAVIVAYLVFAFTPAPFRVAGMKIDPPTWSTAFRLIALIGFATALIYATTLAF